MRRHRRCYSIQRCLRRAVVAATTRKGAGSMINQSDLHRATTTPARRYSKDGIASQVTNRTPSTSSGGGGNLAAAICLRLIRGDSSSNSETQALENTTHTLTRSHDVDAVLEKTCCLLKTGSEVFPFLASRSRELMIHVIILTMKNSCSFILLYIIGILESLGYKDGYRIDVDIPNGSWAAAPHFHDILIFNTGHWWWAPSKFDPVKTPMLFFEKGVPVTPPLTPNAGLDMVLRHMIHACDVNGHLYRALEGSKFQILEITRMSEFRADAHPSTAGGKRHDDCMHWCLPGLTDTWNDLFIAHLNNIKVRN
ncbi:hypothetical protein SASPL_134315 [Salvia splendens]|uniref:Trichome birefringence-like C-terminal domain-containing protein n=1 Tax=Salvia splendens TaxID=180675 RepID=A0A8X8ZJ70_SALSN|nr:hypothetical protein SASPL_134315 [Salvia splendens]